MYDDIPTILTPKELLDKALGRASKIQKEDREVFYRVRKTIQARTESARDLLVETLNRFVKAFPDLVHVESYEREVIEVLVGVGRLRKALGRISGAVEVIERVGANALRQIHGSHEVGEIQKLHLGFAGRVSSVVENLAEPLAFLAKARQIFHILPHVTPGDTTVVVAGYPNVGKSSLLARLTGAHPEIAPYAFTTKHINVGHFAEPGKKPWSARRFQVVDTPGLLEKPPKDRSKIEKQAALALTYLADAIVFVFDPTESCGYLRKDQQHLLESVRKEFSGAPVLVVENKADLVSEGMGAELRVSSKTGEGIEELRRRIVESIPVDTYAGAFPTLEDPGPKR